MSSTLALAPRFDVSPDDDWVDLNAVPTRDWSYIAERRSLAAQNCFGKDPITFRGTYNVELIVYANDQEQGCVVRLEIVRLYSMIYAELMQQILRKLRPIDRSQTLDIPNLDEYAFEDVSQRLPSRLCSR